MANKKNWLVMLVMVFMLGILIGGCMDKSIDGTWIDDNSGDPFTFNSGEFEMTTSYGGMTGKGFYTVEGKNLTITFTHMQHPNGVVQEHNLALTGSISGNKLFMLSTADFDGDGEVEEESFSFTKQRGSNPRNTIVSKITAKNLVGIWELENVVNISGGMASDKDEYFNDGTGITSQRNRNISFTWRLRDGNRLQLDTNTMGTQIFDIELSDNGKLLTYFMDEEHQQKAMYRKK